MNILLIGTGALLTIVGLSVPAVAGPYTGATRVQYTEFLLGGELSCRTLESSNIYYSLEEHVFLALLRGYVLDRYLPQDPGYSQRGQCPRIQWKRIGDVDEITLEVTLAGSQRSVSIWGYLISQETAVSILQSEGFHVEVQGYTIYANR